MVVKKEEIMEIVERSIFKLEERYKISREGKKALRCEGIISVNEWYISPIGSVEEYVIAKMLRFINMERRREQGLPNEKQLSLNSIKMIDDFDGFSKKTKGEIFEIMIKGLCFNFQNFETTLEEIIEVSTSENPEQGIWFVRALFDLSKKQNCGDKINIPLGYSESDIRNK